MLTGDQRVYLQYKPSQESLRHLIAWQKLAIKENPQGRPILHDRFHLTVLHIGIIQDVYRELSEQIPDLDWKTYTGALRDFIYKSQSLLPKQVSVEPQDFVMFGHNSTVLAVALTPGIELEQAHAHSLKQLKKFLQSCGIAYPVPYMQGSQNFGHALTLRPHISLLKAARHRPSFPGNETQELQLEAMPIRYI